MRRSIKPIQADKLIRLPFEFCIVCGNAEGISMCSFVAVEDNPIVHFAKLAGDISIVAGHLLNKPHAVEARFCVQCFRKFKWALSSKQLFYLLFLITIFVTILASTYVHSVGGLEMSFIPLIAGICICIGLKLYSRIYTWKNSPNVRVNKKKLVLKVPGRGKVVCHR